MRLINSGLLHHLIILNLSLSLLWSTVSGLLLKEGGLLAVPPILNHDITNKIIGILKIMIIGVMK